MRFRKSNMNSKLDGEPSMKNVRIQQTALVCLFCLLSTTTLFAQGQDIDRERRAQTGFKFLSISPDARAAGMADALTAQTGASTAMFYNPAGMAYFDGKFNVHVGQIKWIADVDYNIASAAVKTPIGIVGLSLLAVDYGQFEETIRADNESGFLDVGTYSPSALAIGLGYARAITNQFSVGANLKFARQSFGGRTIAIENNAAVTKDFSESTVVVDFGIYYETGFKSLSFAISARNFSRELTYSEESFELPLTFRMGVAMDMVDFTNLDKDMHSILLAVDTERPRDFSEQVKVGVEYMVMNTLAFRGGYIYPTDEQSLTLGVGLHRNLGEIDFRLDYAYSSFGVFDNVNHFGVQLAF
jgi:opacity protein-like surface antigen